MIEVHQLVKHFGGVKAVNDVTLTIETGSITGLIGPNGAGKSTTIRTILNFIKPTDGKIEIFGVDSTTKDRGIMKTVGYLAGDLAPVSYTHLTLPTKA